MLSDSSYMYLYRMSVSYTHLSASRVQPSLMQVYLCFVLELLLDGLEPLPETLELLFVGLCTQQ